MKPKLVILSLLLLLSGCEQKPRYEFHTGNNGLIMWRCDSKTGHVDWAIPNGDWRPVSTDFAAELAEAEAKDVAWSNFVARHPRLVEALKP